MEKKKLIKYALIMAVGLSVIGFTIKGIYDRKTKVDLTVGLKKLEQLEKKKISEVEEKILAREEEEREKLEQQEAAEQKRKNRPPNEKMNHAVIMGDSRTEALKEYHILDNAKVISEIGIEVDELEHHIKEALNRNPRYLFLAYGLNDLEGTYGDAAVFKEQYRTVIQQLKNGLPNTKIYINTILDVQQKAIDRTKYFSAIGEFNQAIQELSKEEKIGLIDVSSLKKDELFEPDGEHLKITYYPLWIDLMAEAAGI